MRFFAKRKTDGPDSISSKNCAGSSTGKKSAIGCSTPLSKMRKSFRLSPDTNRPCESVTVTPTFTRLTVTFSGGPCCAGGSCATIPPAAFASKSPARIRNRSASAPGKALASLFDPSIDVHALRVFPRTAGGQVQMPLKDLRRQLIQRVRQCAGRSFQIGSRILRSRSRLCAPALFDRSPIHFLQVQKTQAVQSLRKFLSRRLPGLRQPTGGPGATLSRGQYFAHCLAAIRIDNRIRRDRQITILPCRGACVVVNSALRYLQIRGVALVLFTSQIVPEPCPQHF